MTSNLRELTSLREIRQLRESLKRRRLLIDNVIRQLELMEEQRILLGDPEVARLARGEGGMPPLPLLAMRGVVDELERPIHPVSKSDDSAVPAKRRRTGSWRSSSTQDAVAALDHALAKDRNEAYAANPTFDVLTHQDVDDDLLSEDVDDFTSTPAITQESVLQALKAADATTADTALNPREVGAYVLNRSTHADDPAVVRQRIAHIQVTSAQVAVVRNTLNELAMRQGIYKIVKCRQHPSSNNCCHKGTRTFYRLLTEQEQQVLASLPRTVTGRSAAAATMTSLALSRALKDDTSEDSKLSADSTSTASPVSQ
ncbi:MAG: hypothetical protein MHM6MM_002545 [Cercozoa sp. M6MM]